MTGIKQWLMGDDEDSIFEGERVNRAATLKLIELHREEYDELTGKAAAARAEQLETQIRDTLRQIAALRKMNPDGVNAPALTDTANALAAENEELRLTVKALTRRADKLAKENTSLRDLIGQSAKGERDAVTPA